MATIFFADLDALRLALASGAVPPAVGRAPARAGSDAQPPPFFSLLRALDRGPAAPRAFVRQAPRVWVEVGFRHPLAELIEPPAGRLLLLTAPRGWESLEDGPFRTGPEQFELPRRPAAGA